MNTELINAIEDAIEDGDLARSMAILNANPQLLDANTAFGTWLHIAAAHGQLEIVKELVRRKVNVNAHGGTGGGNALHRAAAKEHYEVAKFLLDAGSEIDVSEPQRNPLFAAILRDNVEIAQLLIDRGIDVTADYGNGWNAIALAKERGAAKCLEVLEQAKAKQNVPHRDS